MALVVKSVGSRDPILVGLGEFTTRFRTDFGETVLGSHFGW